MKEQVPNSTASPAPQTARQNAPQTGAQTSPQTGRQTQPRAVSRDSHLLWQRVLGLVLLASLAGLGYRVSQKYQRKPSSLAEPDRIYRPDYSSINVTRTVSFELKPGEGPGVTPSSTVKVKFQGWVYDSKLPANRGPEFAKDLTGDFVIRLGHNEVVTGFEKGLLGMKKGSVRRLIIPSSEGYGKMPVANVPGEVILMVEVELLDILN